MGESINQGLSLVEVWAVLDRSWLELSVGWTLRLSQMVIWVAVISLPWVWNGLGESVNQGLSLVEVWAVLDRSWLELSVSWTLRLSEMVVWVAVVSLPWVWNGLSETVNESLSLVKVWAVLDGSWLELSVGWTLGLRKMVVWVAVVSLLWVWNSLSKTVN